MLERLMVASVAVLRLAGVLFVPTPACMAVELTAVGQWQSTDGTKHGTWSATMTIAGGDVAGTITMT